MQKPETKCIQLPRVLYRCLVESLLGSFLFIITWQHQRYYVLTLMQATKVTPQPQDLYIAVKSQQISLFSVNIIIIMCHAVEGNILCLLIILYKYVLPDISLWN